MIKKTVEIETKTYRDKSILKMVVDNPKHKNVLLVIANLHVMFITRNHCLVRLETILASKKYKNHYLTVNFETVFSFLSYSSSGFIFPISAHRRQESKT